MRTDRHPPEGRNTGQVSTREPHELLVLSYADLDGLVSYADAIATQRRAFTSLADGDAVLAPRVLVPGAQGATGFSYLARLDARGDLVAKVGSVNPGNAAIGLPTVSALVVVLDGETGRPVALVDGEAVTNLRTVAASAMVATELRPHASTLAVVGLGVQGRLHAQVLSRALGTDRVVVPSDEGWASSEPHLDVTGTLVVAPTTEEAVDGADVVVTCTTSHHPVVRREWLDDAALVLSIGSFAPDRCEVGPDMVGQAVVVVDDVATASVQAGPVRAALAGGTLSLDDLAAIGDVLTGRRLLEADRLTYYNSVGLGIQDAAVMPLVLAAAHDAGVGTRIPW